MRSTSSSLASGDSGDGIISSPRADRLLDFNPAAVIELAPAVRPKPVIWTDEKVTQWRKDHAKHADRLKRAREGKRVDPIASYVGAPRPSPVMVWTPEQTSAFLAYARRGSAVRVVSADRGTRPAAW
ncbi:hypothetical protein ACIBI9_00770 [Nonomuraea sp. NPDC050451]|uniref:hypothetical protein n=1 Tax=Nonomuraea sp. NPDC050451 TaxID=3364364 RepID=UPI00379CFC82